MGWQYCAAGIAALGLVSACGFGAPDAGDDAPDDGDLGPPEIEVVDTRRSDFEGATRIDSELITLDTEADPDVAIEPAAYAVGGLRARLWDTKNARGQIDAETPFELIGTDVRLVDRQRGTGYRFQPRLDMEHLARGLGHPADDDFLVVFEGEIRIDAGDEQFSIRGDDRLRLEIEMGGAWRSVFSSSDVTQVLNLGEAVEPGWYPIRIAYEEFGGAVRLDLLLGRAGSELTIEAKRWRAPLSSEHGVLVHGFAGPFDPREAGGIAAAPDLDNDYGTTPPYNLDIGNRDYALRYVGQLRVDVAGEYTFSALHEPRDKYRTWIDDQLVAHQWDLETTPTTTAVMLAAGWHDSIVDIRQGADLAAFNVQWQPPDAQAPAPVPAAQLRPVATGGRYAWTYINGDTAIDQNPTIMSALTLPPGARVQFLDTYFGIRGRSNDSLTARLHECGVATEIPITWTPSADELAYLAHDQTCKGMALPDVVLALEEILPAEAGSIVNLSTSATYTGGTADAPFLPASQLVSRVHEVPAGRRLARVTAAGTLAGATVRLAVRTATSAEDLAAAPWEPVDATTGAVPATLPAGAVAQYQITLDSDGWQRPVIDAVSLVYALE